MSRKKQRGRSPRPLVKDTVARYEKALNCYENGQLLKAKQILQKVLMATPQHVDAMILLARVYTRNTDFEAGAAALRKAITFRPDDPQLRVNLGEVLFQGGHRDEALDALYDANRLDGTHLQALDGLSSLLLAAAQAEMSPQIWAEARSFLETFCVLAPGNVAKRWRLAECYDREGNVPQRKRVLKEIINT